MSLISHTHNSPLPNRPLPVDLCFHHRSHWGKILSTLSISFVYSPSIYIRWPDFFLSNVFLSVSRHSRKCRSSSWLDGSNDRSIGRPTPFEGEKTRRSNRQLDLFAFAEQIVCLALEFFGALAILTSGVSTVAVDLLQLLNS